MAGMATAGSGEQGFERPLSRSGENTPSVSRDDDLDPPSASRSRASRDSDRASASLLGQREAPGRGMPADDSPRRMTSMADLEAGELLDRLRKLVEPGPESSWEAAIFQTAIVILILISTAAVIIETVPEMQGASYTFLVFEAVVTVLFMLELSLRFLVCKSTAEFISNSFNIIDFLAILPGVLQTYMAFWLNASVDNKQTPNAMMSLRLVRLIRLARILRLAKVARYSPEMCILISLLSQVWQSSILVILGLIFGLMVVSSSMLYLVEMDRCETIGIKCDGFSSIPEACWFTISTITTVGFVEVVPATVLGKLIASFFSLCAMITLAFAGALLSFDFSEERVVLERTSRSDEVKAASADLQRGVDDFEEACKTLVERLRAVAAQKQREGAAQGHRAPLIMMPMLRLIEERARILKTEAQNCAYARAVWTRPSEEQFLGDQE